MSHNNQFIEDGDDYKKILEKVLVKCPECKNQAVIHNLDNFRKQKLYCPSCNLLKYSGKGIWYGPVSGYVSRRCRTCGADILRTFDIFKSNPQTTIKCGVCNQTSSEKIDWYPESRFDGWDPFFGAELWLSKSVGVNLLWAYNYFHLNYLEEYVSSGLRERVPNINSRLISRLPKWMKDKKKRLRILKAISAIKAKA